MCQIFVEGHGTSLSLCIPFASLFRIAVFSKLVLFKATGFIKSSGSAASLLIIGFTVATIVLSALEGLIATVRETSFAVCRASFIAFAGEWLAVTLFFAPAERLLVPIIFPASKRLLFALIFTTLERLPVAVLTATGKGLAIASFTLVAERFAISTISTTLFTFIAKRLPLKWLVAISAVRTVTFRLAEWLIAFLPTVWLAIFVFPERFAVTVLAIWLAVVATAFFLAGPERAITLRFAEWFTVLTTFPIKWLTVAICRLPVRPGIIITPCRPLTATTFALAETLTASAAFLLIIVRLAALACWSF
jgi:hypothetical protein